MSKETENKILKKLRKDKFLTQDDIALELQINVNEWNEYENKGRTIRNGRILQKLVLKYDFDVNAYLKDANVYMDVSEMYEKNLSDIEQVNNSIMAVDLALQIIPFDEFSDEEINTLLDGIVTEYNGTYQALKKLFIMVAPLKEKYGKVEEPSEDEVPVIN